jgi:hypothetical protein
MDNKSESNPITFTQIEFIDYLQSEMHSCVILEEHDKRVEIKEMIEDVFEEDFGSMYEVSFDNITVH